LCAPYDRLPDPIQSQEVVDLGAVAVEFGEHRATIGAFGDVGGVAAVGAGDDVVGPQNVADADRHGLLSDREMDGTRALVRKVDARDCGAVRTANHL
jgi:hypothetical protein